MGTSCEGGTKQELEPIRLVSIVEYRQLLGGMSDLPRARRLAGAGQPVPAQRRESAGRLTADALVSVPGSVPGPVAGRAR
jgi:hypothetical protein